MTIEILKTNDFIGEIGKIRNAFFDYYLYCTEQIEKLAETIKDKNIQKMKTLFNCIKFVLQAAIPLNLDSIGNLIEKIMKSGFFPEHIIDAIRSKITGSLGISLSKVEESILKIICDRTLKNGEDCSDRSENGCEKLILGIIEKYKYFENIEKELGELKYIIMDCLDDDCRKSFEKYKRMCAEFKMERKDLLEFVEDVDKLRKCKDRPKALRAFAMKDKVDKLKLLLYGHIVEIIVDDPPRSPSEDIVIKSLRKIEGLLRENFEFSGRIQTVYGIFKRENRQLIDDNLRELFRQMGEAGKYYKSVFGLERETTSTSPLASVPRIPPHKILPAIPRVAETPHPEILSSIPRDAVTPSDTGLFTSAEARQKPGREECRARRGLGF